MYRLRYWAVLAPKKIYETNDLPVNAFSYNSILYQYRILIKLLSILYVFLRNIFKNVYSSLLMLKLTGKKQTHRVNRYLENHLANIPMNY